ncbi:unnamed protein product [Dovyalis caffra]|uniref:Uncharacterized protein n=1 Tax=Dovyalis caffra TaxID=77055 RepID=A0AAV1S8J1_9ROSI|nr:unnamed protein product [Dovyalis caffra]
MNGVPLQCKASGTPLPAPGPVLLGPTLPPSAAGPASPQASKAVALAPAPESGTMKLSEAGLADDQYVTCFNDCEDKCKSDGNGYTFCEMKCDADCLAKQAVDAIVNEFIHKRLNLFSFVPYPSLPSLPMMKVMKVESLQLKLHFMPQMFKFLAPSLGLQIYVRKYRNIRNRNQKGKTKGT